MFGSQFPTLPSVELLNTRVQSEATLFTGRRAQHKYWDQTFQLWVRHKKHRIFCVAFGALFGLWLWLIDNMFVFRGQVCDMTLTLLYDCAHITILLPGPILFKCLWLNSFILLQYQLKYWILFLGYKSSLVIFRKTLGLMQC